MGHYRARRMVRPRPAGEPTIKQLTDELAEARRRIVHYAAIIAYQENELRMLRDSMCQGCKHKARSGGGQDVEHEHGGCERAAGGSRHN